LPSSIEIRRRIDSNALVMADPTQVHQVLMNLCANAQHAMRKTGGVLDVSVVEVQLDAEFAAGHSDALVGPYLKLTVADSGEGMDTGVLEKIFDPFFTTKGKEEGTGLGLAVVHGIVKSCGGFITVDSQKNRGSIFNVFLPINQAEAQPLAEIEGPLPTGNERVLFVDDEKLLVDIGRQMLEGNGYRVTPRTSSIEALELFRARSDDFDLVVTDMTMPNMSGLELAREIFKLKPNMPVIMCTGFSETVNEAGARAAGIKAFLYKPVTMDSLIRAARKALDG
jgi:CheY-like chemotaxis protein